MKQLFLIVVLSFYFTTNLSTTENIFLKNEIQNSVQSNQTITLNYNVISCTCPQWSESKYNEKPDKEYFYLEPANDKLINANNLWHGENIPLQIQVTGQIITEAGYPRGFGSKKEKPEAGKVFRYTKIRVLQNGQKKSIGG